MSDEKRFGSSMMGYKKSDVDTYVEIVINQCNTRLEKKDKELEELRTQMGQFSPAAMQEKDDEINQLKLKIASIEADKNAEINNLKQELQMVESKKNAEIETEIEQMRVQLQAFEVEKNAEIEQMKKQYESGEGVEIGASENDFEKDALIDDLNMQITSLKLQLQAQEVAPGASVNNENLEDLKEALEQLETSKAKEDSFQAQIIALESQLEASRNQVSEAMAQIEETKSNVDAFESERSTFTEVLNEKDSEIEALQIKLGSVSTKVTELEELEKSLKLEKDRVTMALVLASEKAENIIYEANAKAERQIELAMNEAEKAKKVLEDQIALERDKLDDVKREMLEMKSSFVSMLKKYEREINQAAGEM